MIEPDFVGSFVAPIVGFLKSYGAFLGGVLYGSCSRARKTLGPILKDLWKKGNSSSAFVVCGVADPTQKHLEPGVADSFRRIV